MNSVLLGFLLALLISLPAWRVKALSRSGLLASLLVGTVVFGLGGWSWAVLLILFFVTSSALTRAFARRKQPLGEKFAKSGARDAAQVLANGGIATLCVLAHVAYPQALWPWLGFAASLAAVNADTWATELGVLAARPPRRLTTWQPVEKGTSGGITPEGTLAALCGSLVIAGAAVLLSPLPLPNPTLALLLLTLGGLFGSLFDSFLGDTVQAIYFCPRCGKETEHHPRHTCGQPTQLVRGRPWLNNDLVNIACALFAAVFTWLTLR